MEKKNKLIEYLELAHIDEFMIPTLGYKELSEEIVQKKLLSFDEFKNVKKINVLPYTTYVGDKETGLPVELDKTNLGDKSKTKPYNVPTYHYNPEIDVDFELAEEIDIYSISLSPKQYDPKETSAENLGVGVWVMPTLYHSMTFEPYKEIKIVFSPEKVMSMLMLKSQEEADKEVKERILKSLEKALDEGLKENVPFKRTIFFRMSERSFKSSAKEEKFARR